MDIFQASLAMADVSLATQWREEDLRQRKITNTRREMDEKVEQLRSISSLAALIAGFDVVVLVELGFPDDTPEYLLTLLAATTALTVCLMCLSFVTCTLMLVGILKAYDLHNVVMPFREFWVTRCEEDWMRAFGYFTWGVPCFLLNLVLCGWVKFYAYLAPQIAITICCVIGVAQWLLVHLKWGCYLSENADASARDSEMLDPSSKFVGNSAGASVDGHEGSTVGEFHDTVDDAEPSVEMVDRTLNIV